MITYPGQLNIIIICSLKYYIFDNKSLDLIIDLLDCRLFYRYSDFQASCNGKPKSVERHLHTLMCSVSVVTVVFIYTMEDDQRLNTLVHEGDALRFSVYHCKKPENRCNVFNADTGQKQENVLHKCTRIE